MVVLVPSAPDETCRVGPVDQTYRTVMPEEQVVGDLADGRTPWVAVTSDGQEELMLGRSETRLLRLLFAPSLELTQAGPQGQQSSVDLVRQSHSFHDIIVLRC